MNSEVKPSIKLMSFIVELQCWSSDKFVCHDKEGYSSLYLFPLSLSLSLSLFPPHSQVLEDVQSFTVSLMYVLLLLHLWTFKT